MRETLEIANRAGISCVVVLNFVPARGRETQDALDLVAALGAVACPRTLGLRKAFFRAQSRGLSVQEHEPDGMATQEMKNLCFYVFKEVFHE